jgi:hypothetical protein
MKKLILAAATAFALAACGQPASEAPTEEAAPAAPASLIEQIQAMSPDQQPVFAWQQLTAYQGAHPEAQPPCTSIRAAEARGVVPPNIDPESIYAGHVGSLVFAIQCGPQLTQVRSDPAEHWLVIFAPGATEAAVLNCAEGTRDRCSARTLPTVDAMPTPAPAATP